MVTYSEAKAVGDAIEAEVKAAEAVLKTFPKGPMGLTPDAVKMSPEFKAAKAAFNRAFDKLQEFNLAFVKAFKKEIREERDKRRQAKLA